MVAPTEGYPDSVLMIGEVHQESPEERSRRVDSIKEVAASHGWIFAGTHDVNGISCLAVYRSIRTEDGDLACMRPVRQYLEVYCHVLPAPPELVKDVTMMGGAAIRETYLVFKVCPGSEHDHQCNALASTAVISV